MRDLRLEHKDGIWWFDAPIPRRIHKCWAQTTAYDILGLREVERCACGAIRMDGDNPYRKSYWYERNSREHD